MGYDQEQRVLEIEFTNGAVYQYFDVPPFHQHVRGKSYRYRRIN